MNISVNLLGAIVTMMLLGAGGVMTFDFYESNMKSTLRTSSERFCND